MRMAYARRAKMNCGFIGLGAIGLPMALRIMQAGFPLAVWARRKEQLVPAIEAGAIESTSLLNIAASCDIICLCVSDTDAVEEVVFGPQGLAEGLKDAGQGKLLIDLSTIHPQRTREMAKRLREFSGAGWVDAPVSGGPVGARAGTLAVMAGGEDDDVKRAGDLLSAFAGQITHMGRAGCGQATKACNQMISASATSGIAEALSLGSKFGLDIGLLPEAVRGGWADSALLQHYMPRMVSGELSGSTKTIIKDLGIACDLAQKNGAVLPITEQLLATYRRVLEQGYPDVGIGSLIYALEDVPIVNVRQDREK